MDDKPKDSWVERIFSGSAIATILVALVGQSLLSIVYQIINNEQQAAQIEANKVAMKTLETAIYNLATPLAARVFRIEDRFEAAERRSDELVKRFDLMDTAGPRALGLISANQQRIMGQIDRLGEREIMLDRRVDSLEQALKRLETSMERRSVPP